MTRGVRRLVAAAAAVAVLGGIYAALLLHPAEQKDSERSVSLTSFDTGALSQVRVTPRGNLPFTVDIAADNSGTSCTMAGETASDYSDALMQALADAACAISARPIEQDCQKPETYGLSPADPTDTLTVTDTGGTSVTLTLGLTVDALGTYCTPNGRDIYLLDSETAQTLTRPQSFYRNLSILDGYYSLSDELKTLSIDRMSDGTALALRARDTADAGGTSDIASKYVFTAPHACDADDTALTGGLFSGLQSGLTARSIAADDPSDLKKYGLDHPVRIHLTANNLDAALLVGAKTDDGGIYVMRDGGRTVFVCAAADYAFLDADWNDWRSTCLMTCALSQISSVSVAQGGTVHTARITHIPADENPASDTDTDTAELDGKAMSADALQQLYLAVTSVHYSRLLDPAQRAAEELRVTLTLTDGTQHTLAFAKGGSREYLAAVDGDAFAYGVPQAEVTSILDALKTE